MRLTAILALCTGLVAGQRIGNLENLFNRFLDQYYEQNPDSPDVRNESPGGDFQAICEALLNERFRQSALVDRIASACDDINRATEANATSETNLREFRRLLRQAQNLIGSGPTADQIDQFLQTIRGGRGPAVTGPNDLPARVPNDVNVQELLRNALNAPIPRNLRNAIRNILNRIEDGQGVTGGLLGVVVDLLIGLGNNLFGNNFRGVLRDARDLLSDITPGDILGDTLSSTLGGITGGNNGGNTGGNNGGNTGGNTGNNGGSSPLPSLPTGGNPTGALPTGGLPNLFAQ